MKKWRADLSQGMLEIILWRILCLPVWYQKIWRLGCKNNNFACYFVWVWNVVSHIRGDLSWRCLRIGCWGEYFGPRRGEVTVEWRRLHNEEICDLFSPNIFREIQSRRMRWLGHVAGMGREEKYTQGLAGETWGKERTSDNTLWSRHLCMTLFFFFLNICIRTNSAHTRKLSSTQKKEAGSSIQTLSPLYRNTQIITFKTIYFIRHRNGKLK